MTRIGVLFGSVLLMAAAPAWAETMDLNCSNGIVNVPLHIDTAAGALTMEGNSFHVGFGSPKILFSMTDPAGDKIDYVLDRAANILTETDHDRMPDGGVKTIALQYTCIKGAN
ncbi:MAG TPA: hypothetical protein VHX99_05670 [Rhizomicrobium sp.]|jgi:hypothetical protein|nr:hypothetical protein [Rhizomicrobium sp.]